MNTKLCVKTAFSAVGYESMWKKDKQKCRGGTRKPNKKEANVGKERVEGEGKRVEIKRTCVDRMLCNCFEDFSSMAERKSDGDSLGFRGV